MRRLTVGQKVAEKPKIALLCGSSRFVDIMAVSTYPLFLRRLQTFRQGWRLAALTDARGVQLLLSEFLGARTPRSSTGEMIYALR